MTHLGGMLTPRLAERGKGAGTGVGDKETDRGRAYMSKTTAARGDAGQDREEAETAEAKATLARPGHCGHLAPSGGGMSQGLPSPPSPTHHSGVSMPLPCVLGPQSGRPQGVASSASSPCTLQKSRRWAKRAKMTGQPDSSPYATPLPDLPLPAPFNPLKARGGLGGW